MTYFSPLEKPIQLFDILSPADFERAVIEAREHLKETKTFHKELNFHYSEKSIGVFSKVCDAVTKTLSTVGFTNPKITSIDFINHGSRTKMNFHKHWLYPNINPYENFSLSKNKSPYNVPFEYFCIAIYYPHTCYQPEYSGELTVKLSENDIGQIFKATPNSLVIHTGVYGHEVSIPKIHPTELRTSCFMHWVCEYDS